MTIDTPVRFPERMSHEQLLPVAYRYMYTSRQLDQNIHDLFKRGAVKGTVTLAWGNEAVATGMALPLRPGQDVVGVLHRDLAVHLIFGMPIHEMLCQFMANAQSPTHAREGNVHHGNARERRFPMMSHLGSMLSPVVGATWAARRAGEDALGLAVIGDGGTSTGDFHESLNLASVRGVPVLFVVENNQYAFSTPVSEQYHCERLSDRAAGYGIRGETVDGTDVCVVYDTVCDLLEEMSRTQLPALLECNCLRLTGHAVYDKAEYITEEQWAEWRPREPVALTRAALLEKTSLDEAAVAAIERDADARIADAVKSALAVERPSPDLHPMEVFASSEVPQLPAYACEKATNQTAVVSAQDYLLSNLADTCILGLDVAAYGSAFKTCKGLFDKYGRERVTNMPLSESAITGFALGASQAGARPIVEFQFADFVTEALTQLGLNCGTWYFRSGRPAPVLVRLPCGGGVTLGAFHSGEFEGLVSRFAGLKLLYPATPQEMFEAVVAGAVDPNPCVVFEHKLLYTRSKGSIEFNGDLSSVWRPRCHQTGDKATIVATGAMVEVAVSASESKGVPCDVWNPFVLEPIDLGPIYESVKKTGKLLVVQESTETAGLADRIVSLVSRHAYDALTAAPIIVAAPNRPVPFAPELETVHRPSVERVERALTELLGVVT